MLFLHGGPGSPEYAFMRYFNPHLENDFIVVYWEQRGAGKSFSKNIPPESMTLEQMVSDTRELSEYLANRFGKKKIYILGYSWGTLLGILTAHKHPELFHAYFGVGQVGDQYRGERVSFDWVKEQAHIQNNKKDIKCRGSHPLCCSGSCSGLHFCHPQTFPLSDFVLYAANIHLNLIRLRITLKRLQF